ncbi:MAG: tail fiber domain-containing protein, partial [Bacteroidota bacterium]|nr:tail fiber domain-containing protein [Bacteroidota bacterium]
NSNEAGGIEVADYTTASGSRAFAVGNDNLASGSSSTAMGRGTIASGDDSTALGANTEASGLHSTAMGYETNAIGNVSTAMGAYTAASGTVSTAMGDTTIANGTVSTAMGGLTTASGNFSTSMGANTAASGHYSTAMGHETQAIGHASTSMGTSTIASGYSSTSMGTSTIASGDDSTAMGNNTLASDYASVAIGQYNNSLSSVTTNGSATAYDTDNTALVIGNGVDGDNRSDALVVKFNGDATLAGNLNINSDARLKANIVSIGSTLSKLLKIDGKSYTMKKDENKKQKIGLLAQDIEKVFPELVSESHGVKSVNYQGLVPILINALKEQDEKMKSQQSQIDELRALVQNLIN